MDPYDRLKLDNQLCFPLYATAKEVVRLYTPLLDELGITYTQYIALMVLWEHREASVKTLGQRLFLDSGTLTPLLKKMEAQGLVLRRRDLADERSVIVTLTQEGAALRDRALAIPERLASCIPIGAEDAKALYTILRKLLGTFGSGTYGIDSDTPAHNT